MSIVLEIFLKASLTRRMWPFLIVDLKSSFALCLTKRDTFDLSSVDSISILEPVSCPGPAGPSPFLLAFLSTYMTHGVKRVDFTYGDVSDNSDKRDLLFTNTLGYQIILKQMSVVQITTNVALLLLLACDTLLGLTSCRRKQMVWDFPTKHLFECPKLGGTLVLSTPLL
jgi:hypothetical protein